MNWVDFLHADCEAVVFVESLAVAGRVVWNVSVRPSILLPVGVFSWNGSLGFSELQHYTQAWSWEKCHMCGNCTPRFILWCAIVAQPKDLWRVMKIIWDIITKVAPKVYLQLWPWSYWPGSGVSEECSKSKHFNGGLPVVSAPIALFRSKLLKGLCM